MVGHTQVPGFGLQDDGFAGVVLRCVGAVDYFAAGLVLERIQFEIDLHALGVDLGLHLLVLAEALVERLQVGGRFGGEFRRTHVPDEALGLGLSGGFSFTGLDAVEVQLGDVYHAFVGLYSPEVHLLVGGTLLQLFLVLLGHEFPFFTGGTFLKFFFGDVLGKIFGMLPLFLVLFFFGL